jgi:hypothetical protein
MDQERFANLARRVSRRSTMVGMVAGILGIGVAGAVAGDASAVRPSVCRPMRNGCTRNDQCCSAYCERRKSVPRRSRYRCGCGIGMDWCDGACVDLGTDANCAHCGDACAGYDTCVSGQCVDACLFLTCDVDETCVQGACRANCVAGDLCDNPREVCTPALGVCLPNGCYDLDDIFYQCIVNSAGEFLPEAVANWLGGTCAVDEDCASGGLGGVPPAPADEWPGWAPGTGRVGCVKAWVESLDADPNSDFTNTCAQYATI